MKLKRSLLLKTTAVAAATFILLLGVFVPAVSAHRLYMVTSEAGKLQVLYEGGIPAGRAVVRLYDRQGAVISEGPADEEGFFYFDPSPEIARATANDGLGHLARLDFEPEEQSLPLEPPVHPNEQASPPVTPPAVTAEQPVQLPPAETEGQLHRLPLAWRVVLGLLFLGVIGTVFYRRTRKF